MFGIDSGELLIIAVVALVVIGPRDLPRLMRTIGQWVGQARGMARHFRTGVDTMMREADLEEMEKKWKADNERIMRDHPLPPPADSTAGSDRDKADAAEPAPVKPRAPPAPAAGALPSGAAPPIPPAPPSPVERP